MRALHFEDGADGVLVACLAAEPAALEALPADLDAAVRRLAAPDARGLILTGTGRAFGPGVDVDRCARWTSAAQAFETTMARKAALRRLECQGKPVVAAITGDALGVGLEVALACHARLAVDDAALALGLPDVSLGLIAGSGGSVRLSRLLGIRRALSICTTAAPMTPRDAAACGLVDGLAPDAGALLVAARAWIAAHPTAQQPWDRKGFVFPGGDARSPALAALWSVAPAAAALQVPAARLAAVDHALSALFEGGLVDVDTAFAVESRQFAACVMERRAHERGS